MTKLCRRSSGQNPIELQTMDYKRHDYRTSGNDSGVSVANILYYYRKEKPIEAYAFKFYAKYLPSIKKSVTFCRGCSISKPSFLVQHCDLSQPKMKI